MSSFLRNKELRSGNKYKWNIKDSQARKTKPVKKMDPWSAFFHAAPCQAWRWIRLWPKQPSWPMQPVQLKPTSKELFFLADQACGKHGFLHDFSYQWHRNTIAYHFTKVFLRHIVKTSFWCFIKFSFWMPASDVTKYCARLPMQPADRQALQPIPHGSSCSSSHDPKLTLEVSKGKLLCHFAPNFLHFRLPPTAPSASAVIAKPSRKAGAALPWRLGAREAVTASPWRGKLGFKSQEQRSNEVLNYFFLLENISMIWSTRFLFLNMALWNQYPFAQFLPRWTMWMWDKVIMKVYWTWRKGTK